MQESFKTVLVLKPSRDLSNILCCNLQIKVKECRMKFTGGVQNGYVGRPTWSEDGKVPGRVTTAQEPLNILALWKSMVIKWERWYLLAGSQDLETRAHIQRVHLLSWGKLIIISIISGQMVVAPLGCESWWAGGLLQPHWCENVHQKLPVLKPWKWWNFQIFHLLDCTTSTF